MLPFLIPMLIGAGIGAATNKNPLQGALIGGTLGAFTGGLGGAAGGLGGAAGGAGGAGGAAGGLLGGLNSALGSEAGASAGGLLGNANTAMDAVKPVAQAASNGMKAADMFQKPEQPPIQFPEIPQMMNNNTGSQSLQQLASANQQINAQQMGQDYANRQKRKDMIARMNNGYFG